MSDQRPIDVEGIISLFRTEGGQWTGDTSALLAADALELLLAEVRAWREHFRSEGASFDESFRRAHQTKRALDAARAACEARGIR